MNKSKKTKRVAAPVALTTVERARAPRFGQSSNGVRIAHREYAATLSNGAASSFTLMGVSGVTPGYDINPGCTNLFPWLSGIAQRYEKYKFTKLVFHLTPSVATSTAGKVYMAVDYDYDDEIPTSKLNMMTNHTMVQTAVWNEVSMEVDCKLMNQNMDWRYTLTNSSRAGGVEPRTVYGGFLLVAVDGTTISTAFDLWVDYEVYFSLERLDEPSFLATATDYVLPERVTSGAYICPSNTTLASNRDIKVVHYGETEFPPVDPKFTWLVDVANAAFNTLEFDFWLRDDAAHPGVNVVNATGVPKIHLFDEFGTSLNSYVITSNGIVAGTVGKGSSDITLNGSYARMFITLLVSMLRQSFPKTRYVGYEWPILAAGVTALDLMKTYLLVGY